MTEWADTVKKTFEQGRLTNPTYQFKDALRDAKKFYKKGKNAAMKAKSNVTYRVKKMMKKGKTSKRSKIPYKKTMKRRKYIKK